MAKAHFTLPELTPQEIERFRSKIQRKAPDACWEWMLRLDKDGYGRFWLRGHNCISHRIAYFLHYGYDPGEALVCHSCDNPSCHNGHHLFAGTPLDNMRDKIAKGRARYHGPYNPARGDNHYSRKYPDKMARGDRHGWYTHPEAKPTGDRNGRRKHPERFPVGDACTNAVLTNTDVIEMRAKYGTGEYSYSQLLAEYPISKTQLSRIIRRESWKHL